MKKKSEIVPVIMAGGAGVRFWPLSTEDFPKQFLTAFGEKSLYRQAVERGRTLAPWDRVLVMTNARFTPHTSVQSPEIPARNVVLESCRRDTGPAIVLAAFVVEHRWPGGIMVVMPSDHRVRDKRGFRRTIRLAAERAEKGGLVTIGIPPAYPATVYGYLHLDSVFKAGGEAVPLRGFVEKPSRERAEEFLASGRFMWNSGIFVWKSSAILEACQRHLPDVYEILSEVKGARSLKKFGSAVARVFPRVKPISIDYGVMEKADNVWAVPASFDWNDIGGWNAAMDLIPEGRDGNRTRGNVVADGGRGNFLISTEDERPLLCAGLSDCIVVSTKHGVLVCRKDQAEQLKPLVERLRSQESTGKKRGGK